MVQGVRPNRAFEPRLTDHRRGADPSRWHRQRALSQGSAGARAAARLGGKRGYTALVDGYLSGRHRDHPESGCAVPCITEDFGRGGGSARTSYTHQVQEYIAMLTDLIDSHDRKVRQRGPLRVLSALVGVALAPIREASLSPN
jgi:hypothetical protein